MDNDIVNLNIAVPVAAIGRVYSLVGALLLGETIDPVPIGNGVPAGAASAIEAAPKPAPAAASPSAGDTAGAASDDGTVDAHGWPWSADMHASTKGMTKEGLWRMKVGVSRPDPKPGFPKADAAPTAASPASENGAASAPSTPAATAPAADEDDEFAAFRAAADKSNATDAAAAASVPARKWTDADLGALCGQAATKLGDPAPIKAIIAEYVPEGTVAHSRNVPEDKREAFARAVEAKAGITFAG